jgi:hypothetical protein
MPHANQGLKWTKSDTLNTAALAAKEMENAFKAIPSARGLVYDFQSGKFRDDAGNDHTRERLKSAVRLGNPKESGIGLSTLQRAIITNSAIRAFARGETTGSFLESARQGVVLPAPIVYATEPKPCKFGQSLQSLQATADSDRRLDKSKLGFHIRSNEFCKYSFVN